MTVRLAPRHRPRFVDRQPTDPAWKAMHVVADHHLPAVRKVVAAAIEQARRQLSLDELASAIGGQRALFSEPDFALALRGVDATLEVAHFDGGQTAGAQLAPRLDLTFSAKAWRSVVKLEPGDELAFQDGLAESQLWVRRNAARFVRQVSAETRAGIRDVVARGFRDGQSPHEIARELRGLVGLTKAQARAVSRFKRNILDTTLRGESAAAKEAQAYAGRLLRLRLTTIARQETLMAANAGQEALWAQAQEKGLVSTRSRRQWIVTPDDRLCQLCFPMSGKLTPIGAPWATATGPVMTPQEIHVQCRCSEGLVIR